MKKEKSRSYHSDHRRSQAEETRRQILDAALKLFESKGIQKVTIPEIARQAGVSPSSIYAIFKSKMGLLRELLDQAFPQETFKELVALSQQSSCPTQRLGISAKIARQMYDSEKNLLRLFSAATALDKDLLEVEKLREERRYQRQKETVVRLAEEHSLRPELAVEQARDILWLYTGRDLYRLLVLERGWSADQYELWVTQQLCAALLRVSEADKTALI